MIADSEFADSFGRVKPGLGSIYRLFHMGELLCLIGLRHVISGILAGGVPGFRMVLLLLHSPLGMAL